MAARTFNSRLTLTSRVAATILLLNKVEAKNICREVSIESQPQAGLGYTNACLPGLAAQGDSQYDRAVSDVSKPLADLHGDVLGEIGETGPNSALLSIHIYWIGIEPNPYMHSYF